MALTVTSFCASLLANCPSMHGIDTQTNCETVFQLYTVGATTDVEMDSLGCRMRYLTDPVLNATATKCQYAGPTGGGRCGSIVEGTCNAAIGACMAAPSMSYPNVAACMTGLAPMVAQWGWNQGTNAAGEDSLECRAYHAITGLVSGDPTHCNHFNFTGSPCSGGAIMPNAQHYCETVTFWCNGTNQQYNSMADCMGSVGAFSTTPADAKASNAMNSLGCREYHSQAAAAVNASFHCEHGGPSGGMACGVYTDAWATLAKNNCNDSDVMAAETGMGVTQLGMAVPVGNSGPYWTGLDQTGDTQACRIYHLTAAATNPGLHCIHGSIAGGGACGTDTVTNLCTFIGGACGFGTATWQFKDATTCHSALAAIPIGTPADRATNTLDCRFYHASVAAQYNTGGSQTMSATNMQTHCSHILASTPAAGCNPPAAPAPTSPAATAPIFTALIVAIVSVFVL